MYITSSFQRSLPGNVSVTNFHYSVINRARLREIYYQVMKIRYRDVSVVAARELCSRDVTAEEQLSQHLSWRQRIVRNSFLPPYSFFLLTVPILVCLPGSLFVHLDLFRLLLYRYRYFSLLAYVYLVLLRLKFITPRMYTCTRKASNVEVTSHQSRFITVNTKNRVNQSNAAR